MNSLSEFEVEIESLETVLKQLHSAEIGDSSLAHTRKVGEIVSSLQMSDSKTARALALAMLIEGTLEKALMEPHSSDRLEMALLDLLYVKRLPISEAAKMLGVSTRSVVRRRSDAVFALARRLILQLG